MKRLFFIAIVSLCLNFTESNAEIRNAYEHQLIQREKCITDYKNLLSGELKPTQRQRLEKLLERALEKSEEYKIYYQKTAELLSLVKFIAPELYKEIDEIKDFLGNETHVYVKVVSNIGLEMKGLSIKGTTNLQQLETSEHQYLSEYGKNTVSVKITDAGPIVKNLFSLVHEMGHVKYQVPNLKVYKGIYGQLYTNKKNLENGLGHHSTDPSHICVGKTLKAFKVLIKKVNWRAYLNELRNEEKEVLAKANSID